MKKMCLRVLAYMFDMILINIILVLFAFINPTKNLINDEYKNISEIQIQYKRLNENINKYYDNDGAFTEDEINEISMLYPYYKDIFTKYELNTEITNEMKNNIKNDINDNQVRLVNEHGYNVNKQNTFYLVFVVIVNILYFGVLEYILKGQTIFKKLFRLRTVTTDGSKLNIFKCLIKSILICELIFNVSDIIFVNTLNVDGYVKYASIISEVKYIYELAFIMVMVLRIDGRSIHDLLLNTKLEMYDKDGNVVENNLFNFVSEETTDKKEVKVKNTKVNKKKSSVKEVVKAEKIDD